MEFLCDRDKFTMYLLQVSPGLAQSYHLSESSGRLQSADDVQCVISVYFVYIASRVLIRKSSMSQSLDSGTAESEVTGCSGSFLTHVSGQRSFVGCRCQRGRRA